MTKPLRFTKIELDNAAKVACAHGVSVRLEVDGSMVIEPVIIENHTKKEIDKIDGGLL